MKSHYHVKISKISFAFLTALALLSAITGCSDDSDEITTETSTTVITTTESETDFANATESTEAVTTTEMETVESTTEETVASDTTTGASDFEILEASADNPTLSAGSATVSIGDKQIDLNGAYIIDSVNVVLEGGTYTSTQSDQNVFLVINGGCLTISNAKIEKSGNAGSSDSERSSDISDDYNFYGVNSVVLCVGENSSVNMTNCNITSESSGANAIFATAGANIQVDNLMIATSGNSSRGVYATYEGTIAADHLDITTSGAHCAPIATDRGGGYITVSNSVVQCSGDGSPCIYSTSEIAVENVISTADGAQTCVIEGKNSITMTDCNFTTLNANNGVMLYQSMSGDAADSDATSSVSALTMTNSIITSDADGPMFYITNTSSVINLNGGNTLSTASGQLVSAAIGRWGNDGSNGGTLTLNTIDNLTESIDADDISSITVNLQNGAVCTGTTSGNVSIAE